MNETDDHIYADVRERVIELLRASLGDGRMSIVQFEEAMGTALASNSEAELTDLVRRLAPPVRITPADRRMDEPLVIESKGMFGDIRLRGRWQVARKTKVQTGPSKIIIDLTEAEYDDWNIDLTLQTGLGDVILTVPRGMNIQWAGVSAGAHTSKLDPPTPGYPTIRLNVMIGFGRLRLKHPRLSRAEKKALKA
ncbi:MAG: hypothetical protein QOI61_2147 [Actinomycetota bacterium]